MPQLQWIAMKPWLQGLSRLMELGSGNVRMPSWGAPFYYFKMVAIHWNREFFRDILYFQTKPFVWWAKEMVGLNGAAYPRIDLDWYCVDGDHKWGRAADGRSAEKRGLQQKLWNQSRVWVQARASWLLFADYENPMSISSFNRNDIYRCWHLHLWFPEAVADLIQSIVGDNNQRRVQIYGTIPTRRLYPESITGSGTHR